MSSLDSSQKIPHTVYFIFGSLDFVHTYLYEQNPDTQTQVTLFDTFTIEDARQLKMRLQEFTDANLVSVVRIEKISTDTQNVLLKVCEELVHTVIVFSFPFSVTLLDTLRSRGFVIYQDGNHLYFNKDVIELFLTSSFSKRVALIDKLTKEHTELDQKGVTRHMIEDLIVLTSRNTKQTKNMHIFLESLKLLEFQKSSSKQIIEYISLMVK
jgi:hypothetical protein